MDLPNFKYFYSKDANTLDIVIHGKDVGMDAPLMQKIIDASRQLRNSVLAFNFPYFDRGEIKSSGEDLFEEQNALKAVMEFVQAQNYEHIRLIGKSLGGIVASFYLDSLSSKEKEKYSVIIFGYVTGGVKIHNFSGDITIIQGEKDKWGSIEEVKKDLENAMSKNIKYFEVTGADHSYRDPETGEPLYEDRAIEYFKTI